MAEEAFTNTHTSSRTSLGLNISQQNHFKAVKGGFDCIPMAFIRKRAVRLRIITCRLGYRDQAYSKSQISYMENLIA